MMHTEDSDSVMQKYVAEFTLKYCGQELFLMIETTLH